MARLPVPGGDDGTWGDVLNQYLLKEHEADGTHNIGLNDLKNVSVGGPSNGQVLKYSNGNWVAANEAGGGTVTDGSITEPKLNIANGPTNGDVLSWNGSTFEWAANSADPSVGGDLSGTASNAQLVAGTVDTTALADNAVTEAKLSAAVQTKLNSPTVPDATTTTKGAVQLAGDLAGTADAPTVPGLTSLQNNKIDNSEKGQPGGVAQLDGSGKVIPGQLVTSNISKVLPYSHTGSLSVTTGSFRLYNDMGSTWTITGVRATVGTAPAGADILVDVHKNGTTIFTTQANRPRIIAGTNTSGKVTNMDVATVADGEYLTVDIDQVGTTTTGSNLTVQIEVV